MATTKIELPNEGKVTDISVSSPEEQYLRALARDTFSSQQTEDNPIDLGDIWGEELQAQETNKAENPFLAIDLGDIGKDLKLTEEESKLENPFLKTPMANQKGFAESMKKAWDIGLQSVDLDREMSRKAMQVLNSGQDQDLTGLQEKRRQLAKEQVYNQGGNMFSRAFLGGAQMLGPMGAGTVEGLKKGGEAGLAAFVATSPALAVPGAGEAITGPVSMAAFELGNLQGSYSYWTEQGIGQVFADAVDLGVNQKTAAKVASYVGPLYAAVEYSQVQGLVKAATGKNLKKSILKATLPFLLKAGENILTESLEEGVQGGTTQAGLEYAKSEEELIKKGAATGLKDVVANMDLGESAKNILTQAADDFVSSIGPMAALGGTASAIGGVKSSVAWGTRKIASGELDKLSEQRSKLQASGAPQTAQAVVDVNLNAPKLDEDPALEEDLEKAGQSEKAQEATPTESPLDAQNTLEAAKAWSKIRSKQPISQDEVKRFNFMLSDSWKLNTETGNFEFQGAPNEAQEGEATATPEATPAAEPIQAPEAQAQAVAPAQTEQPKASQQGQEAVAPTLKPYEKLVTQWLQQVSQAKTPKAKEKLVEAFRNKIDSENEDERLAAKAFDSEVIKLNATKPMARLATTETPKPQAPAKATTTSAVTIPTWEDVQKNKNKIRFLKKAFDAANARLPKESQLTAKVGWKRKDYLSGLEKIYGQISQLEYARPEPQVEAKPETTQQKPSEADEKAAKKKARLASLVKVFNNPNLDGEQTIFRDLAMDLLRSVAGQVARRFSNVPGAEGEIYDRTLARIARQIKNSVDRKTPVLFNKKGEALPVTRDNVSKWIGFAADSAALDAARERDARRELSVPFDSAPPEGAITQPAAAQDAAKPNEQQIAQTKDNQPKEEPKATQAIRQVASELRKQMSPEAKVVLDWVVSQIVGDKNDIGKLTTYKELAKYLSQVAGRTVSEKKVATTVNDVVQKLSDSLNEDNIKVNPQALEMIISPEGKAARERLAGEEAQAKQDREVRKAQMDLADRARNLDAGYSVKDRIINLVSSANAVVRGRINAEVLKPAEEGLLEDEQINQRLDNIEKGQPNEKPTTGETISGSNARSTGQTKESKVRQRTGESRAKEPRTANTEPSSEGKPANEPRGDQSERARSGRGGRKVEGKQQGATESVSVDPRLAGKNTSPAVRKFVDTVTSSGIPVRLVANTETGKPVSVVVSSAETETDPVIQVNPNLLSRVAKTLGAKAYATWSFLALTEEVVHFKYLKMLAGEAKELGISFQQHLKNETKRIAAIIKRRRGLRQKLEKLYNNGEKFSSDFEMVFEFMRMIPQEKLTGTITEASYLDVESIIRSMEPQERRFIFRFMDAIRDFLYGITGRTAAETKFLRETADAIVRMSSRISRNLASPTEKLPVQMNYYKPTEKTIKETDASRKEAEEEAKSRSGLESANLEFLQKYAKDLGIKVPTGKRTLEMVDEKTKKVVEKTVRFPIWKKAEYVEAIKQKLKETQSQEKEVPQDETETELGAALPTDRPYWLKPDGSVVDVEENALIDMNSIGSHSEAALDYLRENSPKDEFLTTWGLLDPLERKERQGSVVDEMLKRGWLRVVGDAFNLYFEGNPNQAQLNKLFEAAIEDEVKLIQDLSGTTGRAKSKLLYEPPMPDELGAAMPRHGFSTTQPRFLLHSTKVPSSLDGLKQVSKLAGTHDVRLYMDKMGNKFVVKYGQTDEQFENEVAADTVYRILNYPVPPSKIIETSEGKAKISAYVNGVTLGRFEEQMAKSPEVVDEVYKRLADGVLIDAFLFNYDVLGQDKDNIVVAHEEIFPSDVIADGSDPIVQHTAYRIDNGGSLDTRAMGLKRNEPFFYDSFKRLQEKYPKLQIKPTDIVAQIGDLVLNMDSILNSIPERLRLVMAQRLQWMADQLSALDTLPPASGYTEDEVKAHFERLSKEMAAVKVARNEAGDLINEKTNKPSRIALYQNNGKLLGYEPKSEFRYRLERTATFKMWFGDWENNPNGKATSKVLDESGEPMLMYHGTRAANRLFGQVFKQDSDFYNHRSKYPRAFAGNMFRGTWLSTSRKWAEDWAENTGPDKYDEQVVIPMYAKSTNPFDPSNQEHIERLISYLKAKNHDVDPVAELALREGYDDWTIFESRFNQVLNKEGTDFVTPPQNTAPNLETIYNTGDTEEKRKQRFFSKMPYPTLEAIINLGFDGLWTREKGMDESSLTERQPLVAADRLFEAIRSGDKAEESKERSGLFKAIKSYKDGSVLNLLSFRPDGVKSAANVGIFKSKDDQNKMKERGDAQNHHDRVIRNPATYWNEFTKNGTRYVSYEPAENLVTYAFASPTSLRENNIAKTKLQDGLYYVGARTAPSARSFKREPMDILGAAMPRRFGVRLKDSLHKDAYDRLTNLTYEPIPDAMVEEEAVAYLEKNGIRGSIDAALSKSSPLEYGSREVLAQIVIQKLNEEYDKTKDPRILEDLISFTDAFLSASSEAGRALRALRLWTLLSKEGILMLYRKKLDETNREKHDRFNEFFAKVKKELSSLPEGALDKVLKDMEGTLQKADKAGEEARKKIAVNNTMTFWESFANQIGESLVRKASDQLKEAEAATEEETQEGSVEGAGANAESKAQAPGEKAKNAKVINQAAQELSQNIKKMFMALADEQGRRIRDPRTVTDEEFANKTTEELEQIRKAEKDSKQLKKLTDMLEAWPKAKQAWQTAVDAIRAKTATNPDLAQLFNEFVDLSLESPFTMPQIKRLLSLKGIKVEDLIRQHYQEGKLANNAYSLARELVDQAGIGAWEEGIGADYKDQDGFYKYKQEEGASKDSPSGLEKIPSLSERLANAIALQIQKYVTEETSKKLDRIIKRFSDKRLQPSLKRFAKRLIEYQALGLFHNSYAWNEFQKQEGLDKVDPEVVQKLVDLVGQADKLTGFRKEQKYADAISLIAYKTEVNTWNFARSWWYFSILSGLMTQAANLLGNFANNVLMVGPILAKHLALSVTNPANAKAVTQRFMQTLSLSLKDMGYLLYTGVSGTRKTEDPHYTKQAREFFEIVAKNTPSKPKKAISTAIAMVGRTMSAIDMLFYNFGKEAYLYNAAYNQAREGGLSAKDATKKALELTFTNSEALAGFKAVAETEGYVVDDKAGLPTRIKQNIEQAIRVQEMVGENMAGNEESKSISKFGDIAGNETTFNEEPKGFLGAVHRHLAALTNRYNLISLVVPFTRIVANVWNQGIDFTGLGLVKAATMKDLSGTAEEVEAQKKLMRARGLTGLAAIATTWLLDSLTCGNYDTFGFEICVGGPGPKEVSQRELLKNRLKWKPNALFLRAKFLSPDGIYVSYLPTPLSFGLGTIGLFKDNQTYRYFSSKTGADQVMSILLRTVSIPFEMNFLSGLGDVFDILSPSNPESALAKAKSFASRLGSSLLMPNVFRDIDQLTGWGGPRTTREGLLQGMFIANTPFVRQAVGMSETDLLGKPVYMTSRIASGATKDPLVQALIEKNALPSSAQKDKLFGVVPLDDEQYAAYRNERSKILGKLLDNPSTIQAIKNMDPYTAQVFVSKMTSAASQQAKANLINKDPSIVEGVGELKTRAK